MYIYMWIIIRLSLFFFLLCEPDLEGRRSSIEVTSLSSLNATCHAVTNLGVSFFPFACFLYVYIFLLL